MGEEGTNLIATQVQLLLSSDLLLQQNIFLFPLLEHALQHHYSSLVVRVVCDLHSNQLAEQVVDVQLARISSRCNFVDLP